MRGISFAGSRNGDSPVKTLVTVMLGFVVLITGFACFWLSMCAISGDGGQGGSRASYALVDLVDIGIMVGAILLIAKLNQRKSGGS